MERECLEAILGVFSLNLPHVVQLSIIKLLAAQCLSNSHEHPKEALKRIAAAHGIELKIP